MLSTIILRYRSLGVEATVDEHVSLIREHGETWWGWWKKDIEPSRNSEIEAFGRLYQNTKDTQKIGLFDRSTGNFFSAIVSGIHFFDGNDTPSPEPTKTPSYYRNASVPLWLNFSEIVRLDRKSFINVFGGIPKGDHTFFPVDFEKPGHFDSGISQSEAIKLPHDRIIQLSDIHFGDDFGFPSTSKPGKTTLFDRVKYDLSENFDSEVGIFLISGDITSKANFEALIGPGLDFLKRLSDEFSVPRERFVIIPGNHDIALSDYSEQDYSHERSFKMFLKEFYGEETDISGLSCFTTTKGSQIQFLRMNSVRLRKKSESAFGYVGWPMYDGLLETVEYHDECIRIATMHHHLVAMQNEDAINKDYPYAHISTTVDAGSVINGLQKNKFDLVLHGHQHIPGTTKICRGQINDTGDICGSDGGILAVSAGSAGVKNERLWDDFRDNSFNVINILDKKFEIISNSYNTGRNARKYFKYN